LRYGVRFSCDTSLRDSDRCPFRKLHPTILMMKSAQDVGRNDASAALHGPVIWSIFAQAKMGPPSVTIMTRFSRPP
jgi:hypothetical protein